jgi:hypothetical protein
MITKSLSAVHVVRENEVRRRLRMGLKKSLVQVVVGGAQGGGEERVGGQKRKRAKTVKGGEKNVKKGAKDARAKRGTTNVRAKKGVKKVVSRGKSDTSSESELSMSSELNEEEVEADLYKVEKIIDHRCGKKGKEVLVNWEGYGSEDNSWEPEKDIRKFADFRVQQYYDKLKLIDPENSN